MLQTPNKFIPNGETLKPFSSEWGTRKKYSPVSKLHNTDSAVREYTKLK